MDTIPDTAFLTSHTGSLSLLSVTTNLLVAAILCGILSIFYVKYGTSLTNRNHLAKTFMMLGVTTTLIITIVKSSLALSLGLVGALSIVRFRAAIKEPEELVFLFLAIAIGLGFGADQGTVTTISFALILLLFFIHKKVISTKEKSDNVYLSVVLPKADAERSAEVTEIVTSHISNAKIKRLELSKECAEMVYLVNMTNYSELEAIRNELNTISEEITYSFVEEANVF